MSINFQVNGSVFKEGEGSFFIEVKGQYCSIKNEWCIHSVNGFNRVVSEIHSFDVNI